MRAYLFDNLPGDQREPHDTGEAVDPQTLQDLGVLYREVPLDEAGTWENSIDCLAKERGYNNKDSVTINKDILGEAYESKIKTFFNEHLHEGEEIRYIVDGCAFFDIRGHGASYDEQWIRIRVQKGDLIILPAGIYHRFTVDNTNTVTAMRWFPDNPNFTAYPRIQTDTDGKEVRTKYLEGVKIGSNRGVSAAV